MSTKKKYNRKQSGREAEISTAAIGDEHKNTLLENKDTGKVWLSQDITVTVAYLSARV